MSTNSAKISIIVLAYKEENYLKECLDSLLSQTLQEIEIICVYDRFCEKIGSLLFQCRTQDKRMKLIPNESWNCGAAWNMGAEQAEGEYILFWDSVKSVSNDALEVLYKKATDALADIVFFETKKFNTANRKYLSNLNSCLGKDLQDEEISSQKKLSAYIRSLEISGIESKVFRKQFLKEHKLDFPVLANSSEIYFMLMAIALAGRIAYTNAVTAEVCVNLSGWKWNMKNHTCFLEAYLEAYHELQSKGVYEKIEKGFAESFVNDCYKHLNENRDRECQLEICKRIREISSENPEIENEVYRYMPDSEKAVSVFEGSKYALLWYEKLHKTQTERSIEVLKGDSVPKNRPKVSVIIPVYNVELYLRECLDSVIRQTLSDIEIICINDGSTDHSEEILFEYARDERVTVIRQSNSGLSATRNVGINYAKGKYLYFLDSDDCLTENALEEMYKCAEKSELDVVYCDGCSFSDDSGCEEEVEKYREYYTRKYQYEGVFTGAALFKEFLEKEEYRVQVSLQMIRREYLLEQQLAFYEGIIHEDNLFNYCCMLNAKRVSYIGKPLFLRRVRSGSIVTSGISFANVYGYFCCYVGMYEFLQNLQLRCEEYKAAIEILSRTLYNVRSQYAKLTASEKYSYLGMPAEQRKFFEMYVLDIDTKSNEIENVRQQKNEIVRIKQELAGKLQIIQKEKRELNQQIQKLDTEKENVDQKLQQVSREKTEISQKLQQAYQEKNEITQKLQKAYQEKSEISQKLKKTYEEKAERGVTIKNQRIEIRELKKVVAEQKQENQYLRSCVESTTYKVGKVVMFIPCSMKDIIGKIKNKLSVKIKKIRKNRCIWKRKSSEVERKAKVWLIGVPQYGNLGDHQIVESTMEFLRNIFPDREIEEVSMDRFSECKEELKQDIEKEDLLCFHGGGNVGNLWPRSEYIRREAFQIWKDNKKIVMPQSVFFTDDEEGKQELVLSKRAYSDENILLICREEVSYQFAKENFQCQVLLMPDMVMYSNRNDLAYRFDRKGALLCLRRDKEKNLTEDDVEYLKRCLTEKYSSVEVTDTVISGGIKKTDERKQTLDQFLEYLAKSEVVVTDRLHGGVFCALTGTPCIIFPNNYYKIEATLKWLDELKYVKVIHEKEEFPAALEWVTKQKKRDYQVKKVQKKFRKLSKIVKRYL